MDALDPVMERLGASAFMAYGSSSDADMRYLTHFVTGDPVVYLKRRGEAGVIIVSQMEAVRASRESRTAVLTRSEAGLFEIMKTEPDRWKAIARMVTGLAGDDGIVIPPQTPYALGRALAETSRVHIDGTTVPGLRSVKNRVEISAMKRAQTATDMAMNVAVDLIRKARPRNGLLTSGGMLLTSERIRAAMHQSLVGRGCTASETIVAPGEQSSMPHCTGSGPIRENDPVVIDLFPRDDATGYHTDMTRTVVRGTPSEDLDELYKAVLGAFELACSMTRPGVTGVSVHQSVVDYFKDCGYESGPSGFTHNLGHGVGLEVHELPTLGVSGEQELARGNVVTIEPGLYYEGIGGVRIEDTGVLTRSGFSSFTRFSKEMVL
jgi:Xaa-Pro aminopeptidase